MPVVKLLWVVGLILSSGGATGFAGSQLVHGKFSLWVVMSLSSRAENICISEGPVLVIAIFQVEKCRDLELQMCRDFVNLEFKMCRDLELQMCRDLELQMRSEPVI